LGDGRIDNTGDLHPHNEKAVDDVIHLSFKGGLSPQSNSLYPIDIKVKKYHSPNDGRA